MIELRHAGKRYRALFGRDIRALEDVTLDLHAGEVFGIAGPNGAGKSTLIALLLGFLAPSEGTIRIHGLEPRRYVERHGAAYLSELVNIPPTWRVIDALRRYALLSGVAPADVARRGAAMLETLGLGEHRTKRVRQLSKGNLQRLGLAQALLSDARVVILDEPTHGLDPVWTQRFRAVVDGLRRSDRLILIASHNLDELSRLADRVGIVDRGRLQRVVDMRDAGHASSSDTVSRVVVTSGDSHVAHVFPAARRVAGGEFELAPMPLAAVNAGLVALIGAGALVSGVYAARSELEQQFHAAISDGAADGNPRT